MSDKKERTVIMRNPPPPALRPRPLAPWREVLSSDPAEQELLASIRRTPADEDARMVYADWLEQRGRTDEAGFVRHAGKLASNDPYLRGSDPAWRRIVGRSPIALCNRKNCPGRWDLLLAERNTEEARGCMTCEGPSGRAVRYVTDYQDAKQAGAFGDGPVVIDPAADVADLMSVCETWRARR